jgi:parallel beta-helix repeat protein
MKTRYVIAPIMMLAMLAVFSVPAMAYLNVVTVKTGTVTDGTVLVQEGPGGTDWRFYVPDGDVQFVRVHWHCWMQDGYSSATFTNSQGPQQHITIPWYVQTDNYGHWECGYGTSHNYWTVNATPGWNTLSGITNCDCLWKFVDIVVDNTTEPATYNGRWWLNQGLIKPSTYNTWFYGSINPAADYTLWTVQSHHEHMKISFNDVPVDEYDAGGDWFDVRQNLVSNIDSDESQKVTWENTYGTYSDFFVWAAMLAEGTPEPKPDLVVWGDIEFQPETLRPSQNFMVKATILNQGNAGTGVPLNVSLSYFGNGEVTVEPLAAGASATVSFTDVSLSGDQCYFFQVIADCDNNVSESNENNNAKSEYHQIGYVIAVRSNSDFDDLKNEGLATKVGDTYYIQNLTITNCAGCGITIENTNVPFVINNCTVRYCGYGSSSYVDSHGICMYNVTDGKVTDNMLYGNTNGGISVVESTHVDVTNNSIYDNSCGIKVGAETQFINVTCNELYTNVDGLDLRGLNCTVGGNFIHNNTIYGIYVFGNDNVIYSNTIKNNGDYGIKMYNSSGNCIFWNDFIENNLYNPWATSQAWDNNQG